MNGLTNGPDFIGFPPGNYFLPPGNCINLTNYLRVVLIQNCFLTDNFYDRTSFNSFLSGFYRNSSDNLSYSSGFASYWLSFDSNRLNCDSYWSNHYNYSSDSSTIRPITYVIHRAT